MDYKFDDNYEVEERNDGSIIYKHPAFATMGFYRTQSNARDNVLFGSSIYHGDTIHLRIAKGILDRSLNEDRIYGDKVILEAEMSNAQFAEAITSMNNGSGVPITLLYTEKDKKIPPCHFVDKNAEFKKEMKDIIQEYAEKNEMKTDRAKDILQKKTIGKADRQELMSIIEELSNPKRFDSHARFVYSQFQEQMNKSITQAKSEIEAFTQNKLLAIANRTLIENREELNKIQTTEVTENLVKSVEEKKGEK